MSDAVIILCPNARLVADIWRGATSVIGLWLRSTLFYHEFVRV